MLQQLLILACALIIVIGVVLVPFPNGLVAIATISALAAGLVFLFRRFTDEKQFITMVFLTGLALRMGFGLFIEVFDLREFFGGDANTYDENGAGWMDVWLNDAPVSATLIYYNNPRTGAGWGMNFLTAVIYVVVGRNLFAAQSFCALVGAATAPMTFFCARKVYNNLNAAKFAAVCVAVSPALVIWSSQLLKDGLLVFLLVTTMTLVLELQKKIRISAVIMLILALVGILSLRFYIFYMVMVAVCGSFVIGFTTSTKSIVRGIVLLGAIGLGLTYFGAGQDATAGLEVFGNLERIQQTRAGLTGVTSGFGREMDVSTTEGAISTIPIGLYFLMFAPFPWHAENFRQAITIPDVLAWWALLPFGVLGLVYTIRYRLRNAFPILVFSLLLLLGYALFQGNVGTAYRQRTQVQVFLFILIGVGWTVFKEQRENKGIERAAVQQRLERQIKGRVHPSRN